MFGPNKADCCDVRGPKCSSQHGIALIIVAV